MNEKTLVVIDMQNIYLEGNSFACLNMDETINNIILLIESHKLDKIIFTKFIASKHPKGKWKKYNERYHEVNKDVYLNEIIDKLLPYSKKNIIIEKHAYSCYSSKEFKHYIKNSQEILLTGVVDDCCVMSTIYSGIDNGDNIIIIKDGIAGIHKEGKGFIEYIGKNNSKVHLSIKTTKEYLENSSLC